MGGEITWNCLGNGQFQFELKLFRDCSGQTPNNTEYLRVYNHPSLDQIEVSLVENNDLSPSCNGISFDCSSSSGNATEEYVYRSNPLTISGTPPAEGFIFTFNECCRNANLTNIPNAGVAGMTLRAVMYSFNNQDVSVCFDSSPTFNYIPSTVFCSGDEISINHQAFDSDLDSLVYFLANPMDTLGTASCPIYKLEEPCVNILEFNTGYSTDSPLPDVSIHPDNVPLTLDEQVGEMSFASRTTGRFITVIGLKSYKCGQLVSEVFREVQLVVMNCSAGNDLPTLKVNNQDYTRNIYYDTVEVGDLVNIDLAFYDDDKTGGFGQVLSFEASGNQFGSGFINPSSGCTNGECAVLTNIGLTSEDSLKTSFSWQTSCNHVSNSGSCENLYNTYTFHITAKDDFCPLPGERSVTLAITVKPKDYASSSSLTCVSSDQQGSNFLEWTESVDNESSFDSYGINFSTDLNSSFQQTPLSNINQVQYEHVGINIGVSSEVYYYLAVNTGCHGLKQYLSDTISNVVLSNTLLGNNIINLTWNQPYHSSLQTNNIDYILERKIGLNSWLKIDTVSALSYIDTVGVCGENVSYRLLYTIGTCQNESTETSAFLSDDLVPNVLQLDSLSYNNNDELILGWQESMDEDVKGYIVYLFNGTVWNPYDTIFGKDSTFYNAGTSIGSSGIEKLRLAPMDSCENTAAMGDIHESLYLSGITDKCDETLSLDWEPYVGWPSDSIQLIGSKDGGQDSVYVTMYSESEYVLSGLINESQYCFYLRAYGNGRSTRSNNLCININWLKRPDLHYLANVSVDSSNQIILELLTDRTASFTHYEVFHGKSTDDFELFEIIPKVDTSYYRIIDDENDPLLGSHYYFIVGVDSCGNSSDTTLIARTIDFTTRMNRSGRVEINFSSYINWENDVLTYRILREVEGIPGVDVFMEISGGQDSMSVIDDNFYPTQVCYTVEASENPGSLNFTGLSYSMQSCTDSYIPDVFVENAFSPNADGINDLFRYPSIGLSSSDYQLVVYNRSGQVVFESNTIDEAWDGNTQAGNPAQLGVYIYYLKAISEGGATVEKMGHITLVR